MAGGRKNKRGGEKREERKKNSFGLRGGRLSGGLLAKNAREEQCVQEKNRQEESFQRGGGSSETLQNKGKAPRNIMVPQWGSRAIKKNCFRKEKKERLSKSKRKRKYGNLGKSRTIARLEKEKLEHRKKRRQQKKNQNQFRTRLGNGGGAFSTPKGGSSRRLGRPSGNLAKVD